MVNYYKILKISPESTTADIKAAYRRLAREMHPDIKGGDEKTHQEFAQIIKAYEVLSNPKRRANFDRQLNGRNGASGDSLSNSENYHARRLRQIALENRYNQIIDRMIADERQETLALQRIVFPMVALFVSTCFVGIFKPAIWSNSGVIGKLIIGTLFVVGILHLLKRIKNGMDRYTSDAAFIHDSIFEDVETPERSYSKLSAILFLIFGTTLSFGIGYVIGNSLEMFIQAMIPRFYSPEIRPEFVFYPPIIVLLVDALHKFVSRFE